MSLFSDFSTPVQILCARLGLFSNEVAAPGATVGSVKGADEVALGKGLSPGAGIQRGQRSTAQRTFGPARFYPILCFL